MEPQESATPMAPPSRSLREQTQKRQRNSSPVTPSKRRRVQHLPSSVSQRTPASTQISCTSTPLSGPRTRAQLDRYYEDVKRDARRIIAVKNQLDVLLPEVDTDPQSTPAPTSGSMSMTTKNAVKLLEKILKDNQLIEDLEEVRKEVDPKVRGPRRSDTDGVVKHYRKKQQTTREKLRKDIRKARKRIGYNWDRLKAAQMVTEPEASTAEDTVSSSISYPVVSVAATEDGDDDSGAMADDSDSEPMLPTGNTVARSIMSPSFLPDHTVEEENRTSNDKDKAKTKRSGENGDADREASKINEPVEGKAAPESLPRTVRAPRRSIYTPDSVDDEDRPGQTGQKEISTHTATEESPHSDGGLADKMVEETTKPTNPREVETQVKPFSRRSDDEISDSGEDEDSSEDDEDDEDGSDVEIKEEDEDLDVKLDMFGDGSEDDDEDEDEDESNDVGLKVEVEDQEEFKESSEDTRTEQDKEAEEATGDIESQKKGSDERLNVVQSGQGHPEDPKSSRPTTGLFERMNGIQTSGSFEAMMAGLRQAAAERERLAVLNGRIVDTDTSDSSDDESLPDWPPESDTKPSIA
ncbi:uncharacterized protein N7473_000111 [Penicillium subrubescens]|uniref:uncharacterized protein n=1 Tax=Penicillium subrubescens TaxID=1316194 RepID=UPI0025456E77|nr:uncharacterized protein N7473_000111 [Penicillium subrubescens]KAJ5910808.1 hypothetical protein N7473_000111 [Penicillium subrubescens]